MPTTFREYLSDSLLRAGSERALDRRELEHGIATESIDLDFRSYEATRWGLTCWFAFCSDVA